MEMLADAKPYQLNYSTFSNGMQTNAICASFNWKPFPYFHFDRWRRCSHEFVLVWTIMHSLKHEWELEIAFDQIVRGLGAVWELRTSASNSPHSFPWKFIFVNSNSAFRLIFGKVENFPQNSIKRAQLRRTHEIENDKNVKWKIQ